MTNTITMNVSSLQGASFYRAVKRKARTKFAKLIDDNPSQALQILCEEFEPGESLNPLGNATGTNQVGINAPILECIAALHPRVTQVPLKIVLTVVKPIWLPGGRSIVSAYRLLVVPASR